MGPAITKLHDTVFAAIATARAEAGDELAAAHAAHDSPEHAAQPATGEHAH